MGIHTAPIFRPFCVYLPPPAAGDGGQIGWRCSGMKKTAIDGRFFVPGQAAFQPFARW